MIKKLNEFVDQKAMFFLKFFLFLQPVLDALIGIFLKYNISSIIFLVIKVFFLLYIIYYICFVKKKNLIYILLIFLYCTIFLLTNFFLKKDGNLFLELEILVKNIYLPISLVFILELFKNKTFDKRNLYKILIIYLFLIFVPNMLNLGFDSYSTSKLGSVGFFYSANAIGSIISILMPLFIGNLIGKKSWKKLLIFLVIYCYILITIGTKAPMLCALIVLIYYIILYLHNCLKQKKYSSTLVILFLIIVLIISCIKFLPMTPFYKNLVIHLDFLGVKSFSDLLTFENFDHFIFSARLSCFKNAFEVFKNSPLIQKLFGIGYVIDGVQLRTSEMDYLVMFIHQGIIGFLVLYYMYFKIIFITLKNYFINFKQNFININKSSYILSLIISILCALLAGHVLDTPSVCIFVVTILGTFYNESKTMR